MPIVMEWMLVRIFLTQWVTPRTLRDGKGAPSTLGYPFIRTGKTVEKVVTSPSLTTHSLEIALKDVDPNGGRIGLNRLFQVPNAWRSAGIAVPRIGEHVGG